MSLSRKLGVLIKKRVVGKESISWKGSREGSLALPSFNTATVFYTNRKQRIVLNGQSSSWLEIHAGIRQGSVLGTLLFLIYINDLPNGLLSEAKLFAHDTSIYSTDPNKQTTEVIFSRKRNHVNHPVLYFNETPVKTAPFQKHIGLILDEKHTFGHHLNEKISKANKGIGLIKRLYSYLPRKSLLVIYKSFIWPLLDYGDVIYDQSHNDTLL